jgi:hypothetical protein
LLWRKRLAKTGRVGRNQPIIVSEQFHQTREHSRGAGSLMQEHQRRPCTPFCHADMHLPGCGFEASLLLSSFQEDHLRGKPQ